jgi:hypothetical protein
MRDPAPDPKTATMDILISLMLHDPAGCLRARRIDEGYKRAIVALVNSDIPLDRSFRRWLAGELGRLYFATPTQRRQYERREWSRSFARVVKELQVRRRDTGLTALEAEEKNANMLGISVDALRKRMQRTR